MCSGQDMAASDKGSTAAGCAKVADVDHPGDGGLGCLSIHDGGEGLKKGGDIKLDPK